MGSAGEIHFDGWTLRPSTGELSRGSTKVRLQSRPLLVLEELLSNPGEVVTREQLIARLWPSGVVDFDTALNSAVRRLRTALDDHADTPRYIETIPKRGYRFIGRLAPVAPPDPAFVADPPRVPVPEPGLGRAVKTRRTVARWVALAAAFGVGAMALGTWTWSRSSTTTEPATGADALTAVPPGAAARFERARFLLQRRDAGDTTRAREQFTAALELHPRYARAWSGIASTWWIDTVEGRTSPNEGLARTRAAALRALRIDPDVAEAYVRLANVASFEGDAASRDAYLQRAMRAEPGDPLVLAIAADDAADRGELDRAVALQRRAVEADPLSLASHYNYAVLLFVAGRYAEARTELQEILSFKPGNRHRAELLLAQALVLNGEFEAALALGERMEDAPGKWQVRALAYHALGRQPDADQALRELRAAATGRRSYLLAEAFAFRGEVDPAFASLHDAVGADPSSCDPDTCWPLDWLDASPLLRSLHVDARWTAWLASLDAASSS